MSRVMLLMRLVSLSPYFLSFVPSPGSSLHCKTSRSGHSGGGGGRNVTLERNGGGVETCGKSKEVIRAGRNIDFSGFVGFQRRRYLFSRGRRGVFCERWPYSLTCCALLGS